MEMTSFSFKTHNDALKAMGEMANICGFSFDKLAESNGVEIVSVRHNTSDDVIGDLVVIGLGREDREVRIRVSKDLYKAVTMIIDRFNQQ